ncbi:DUF3108 domain-containing protein [Massilia sp. PWRC2]|uniref:DUF3108 domain-containing protein n=1 Tax=Massilia sp. PWRC2 TaxID=2804626 RepID=UPI003CF952F4
MTNRMFSARHRRTFALALLTVGLHVLALRALVLQAGSFGSERVKPVAPPLTARLIAAPVLPPAPAPPPPLVLAPPPALPRLDTVALPAAARLDAAAGAPVLAALPVEAGATALLADVESIGMAPTAAMPAIPATPAPPAPPALPATPASPAGKAYRAAVPPAARMVLDVARKDADGTLWHGEAVMAWQLADGRYRMKLEAGIRVLVARVNLVVLESSGEIDGGGFVPRRMTEKRRGRALTTTEFGQAGSKITFSTSPASYDLAAGTQDKATIALQLAAIARADSAQLDGNIDILVGEDRDASVFRFVLVGQEEIDTPMGRLRTWHLARPPRFGAYNARFDVWLAPSLGWLPVRIDNIESTGATTSQTVKQIGPPEQG